MEDDHILKPSADIFAEPEAPTPAWKGSAWYPAIEQLVHGKKDLLVDLLERGVPIEPEAARILAMAFRAGKSGKNDKSWKPQKNGLPFRFDIMGNTLPDQKKSGRRPNSNWLRDIEIAIEFEELRRSGLEPREARRRLVDRWKGCYIGEKTIESACTKHRDDAPQWLEARADFRAQMAQSEFASAIVRAVLTKMSEGLERQAAIDNVVLKWRLEGRSDFVERCLASHEAAVALDEQQCRAFNLRPIED